MLPDTPMLHLVCGKIAAGKSTLTTRLAKAPATVLIREDDWMSVLFADQLKELPDYVRCSAKLRQVIGPHVAALLRVGLSVVLDFPANTVASRAWMRGIVEAAGAAHRLHLLDVPDAVCKARLRARNATGSHVFTVTDAQFDQFTSHFVPPGPAEGFDVVVHRATD
jgi:predicted kinase